MSEQLGRKGVLFIFLVVASFLVYLSFFGFTTNTSKLSVSVSPLLQDEAMLYLVSKGSQARCLDGSQPAYYIHRGIGTGKYKWLVFFEGGGWCYDLKQCYLRSKTVLGSSKNYRSRMTAEELRFYFSGSKAANPAMHNWNIVYVRYCDGGSYAGDAVREYNGHTLYFKGKHNRDETIRSLFHIGNDHASKIVVNQDGTEVEMIPRSHNMSTATEVVIAGCSAGGLGAFLGLDQMADLVRSTAAVHGNTHVTVRGLVDSGFFMDHTSDFVSHVTHQSYGKDEAVTAKSVALNGNKTNMDYGACMRDVFEFMNISAGANPACLRAHSGGSPVRGFPAESNCVFAVNLLPHIKTPMFVMQPRFDQWQILHIFSQRYTAEGVNEYGRKLVSALQPSLYHAGNPGHGAFVDSCTHHCTGCSDHSENPWSGDFIRSTIAVDNTYNSTESGGSGGGGNMTFSSWNEAQAFSLWYQRTLQADAPVVRALTPGVNWFLQDRAYPCHDCCKCSVDMVGQLRKPRALK